LKNLILRTTKEVFFPIKIPEGELLAITKLPLHICSPKVKSSTGTWLAQLVEQATLDFTAVSSCPTLGVLGVEPVKKRKKRTKTYKVQIFP